MEEMLSIVQSLASTDDQNGQLAQLYAMLDEHQTFQLKASHELDPQVAHISNLLNDAATKHGGLLLLHQFLPQCQLDIIEQKGALWTTLATKVLAQHRSTAGVSPSVPLALRVLAQLLHKSVHVPELSKALSNTLLAKIVEALLQLPANGDVHHAALSLLEQAQLLHPGAASISRATTEKWILSFADSPDARLVRQSARCLHLLQQTRGGGTAGTTHKIAWSALQLALIGQLHTLLDAVYANTPEVMDAFVAGDDPLRLALPDLLLSDEPIARNVQLVTRFVNLCEYLRTALVAPFPVAKAVQPAKLLSLISRGLAVNCATLASNLITDNIVVGALIPRIHCALFALLDALIRTLGTNMLMYGPNVLQLVLQSLQWTASGRATGVRRPFVAVRVAAYRTLVLWTRVARAACGVERIADELMPLLVQDVTPYQTEVRLKVLSGARRHMSKKARKALHRAQNDATNLAQAHSKAFDAHSTKVVRTDAGNEALCAAALRALAAVMLAGGQFLKPVVHKLLHEHVVRLALAVVLRPAESGVRSGGLYESAECRGLLYAAVQALVEGAQHLCPPPVQYARVIYAAAQARDGSAAVREVCAGFARVVERIVHPQKETLHFGVEATLQRDALKELRQLGGKGGEDVESDEEEEEEEEDVKMTEEAVEVKLEEAAEENEVDDEEEAADTNSEVVGDAEADEDDDGEELGADETLALDETVSSTENAAADEKTDDDDDTAVSENIAPVRREKRASPPPRSIDDDGASVQKKPKVLSVAAMAENAAAEAMVEDLMAEFVDEFVA